MRFYRPLGQISALTFDLDDTLYDNRPVIDRTMHESLAFVRSYHPSLSQFDAHELNQLRQTLLAAEPEIYHDVTVWRHRALELGMRNAGLSAEAAKAGADAAMEHFAHWRSRVDVPQETHDTLAKPGEEVAAGGDYQWQRPPGTVRSERLFPLRAARRAGWPLQAVCRHVPPCGGASECCRSGRFCTSAMI
ncbi:2-haloalkanoic acid dehalogenase [Klebsiella pneumoniae]|uniref:2-haloalkanoic acid dehalogenase n=1 Tax=Klebsiella pneumoniae TaxID=573 RepID=A0A377UTJ5_KLEPN|nr:2-haloalkanoic acid dehalogenase [Klebsiella pneumoniae]